MKRLMSLSALVVTAVVAPGALAQSADFCDAPDSISGYGSFFFDSTFATSSPVAIGCGQGDSFDDVWFCWTAPESGPVVVDLCGGDVFHDTVIAAYVGCSCPGDNSELVCDDDSACGLQSSVSFMAMEGATYLLRIGGYSEGEVGTGSVRIQSGILHTEDYNGHTYKLFSADSWTQAEAVAISLGGHLVAISDQAENDFVQFNMLFFDGLDRRTWIGFNDAENEGNFVWSNGDPVTYTNWNGGEPNDFGGNEDYAEMLGGNGQWNDQPDGGNGFVHFGVVELGGGNACPADFNHDMVVNSQDFFDFLNAFFNADPSADFNNDLVVNSQDFFDFLNAFFMGC